MENKIIISQKCFWILTVFLLWVLVYISHTYSCKCFVVSTFRSSRFRFVEVYFCQRFSLLTFQFGAASVRRRLDLSMFHFVDDLACQRFHLLTFRFPTFRFVEVFDWCTVICIRESTTYSKFNHLTLCVLNFSEGT